MSQPQSLFSPKNASKVTAPENISFNISREANIVDPDQTGSTLFIYEASDSLVDDEKHTFCDYALQGLMNVSSVCIRLGFL